MTDLKDLDTKANTLKRLKKLLKKSEVLDIFSFTSSDWKIHSETILGIIAKRFISERIIIRSSAISEDNEKSSMAGGFVSFLDIPPSDQKKVREAVEGVLKSYKKKGFQSSFNQVLIQPQIKEVLLSGVIFTRGVHNTPYYIINFDNNTKNTDTVTGGLENKTIKVFRGICIKDVNSRLKKTLESVKEIEEVMQKKGLDIEFCVTPQEKIIIFQVRPITTLEDSEIEDEEVRERIKKLDEEFENLSIKKKWLAGEKNIFADMPDWNPAEIIGNNPNFLDYSLYDYLITESIWHRARTSQGYYNVNPSRLIWLFGNKPYVDVRATFNSFIPGKVSKKLHKKLVDFYMNKLKKNPELQDKVEFDILFTCYDFCFDARSKELLNNHFSKEEVEELKESLLDLTNNLILNSKKEITKDLKSLNEMKTARLKKSFDFNKDNIFSLLRGAKSLLEDCKEKGTLQFSRLARLGFIGKILLKSLVLREFIDSNFYDSFMNSIETVAKGFTEDFELMLKGKIKTEKFVSKYAHLRPGTYDITSRRYDSIPDIFHSSRGNSLIIKRKKAFRIKRTTLTYLNKIFKEQGLKFSPEALFKFIKSSLEARELSKFEFTKNLSDALELIAIAGDELGFSRQELSMLSIQEILSENYKTKEDLASFWKERLIQRKMQRSINDKLELPPILFSKKDFMIIRDYTPKPNFITQKKVKARILDLSKASINKALINGKIVMIENGDPGFDWIFTKNPAGLITKYGGVASHMSIRCAEFGMPAAIGCGAIYNQLEDNEEIVIDCKSKRIIKTGIEK